MSNIRAATVLAEGQIFFTPFTDTGLLANTGCRWTYLRLVEDLGEEWGCDVLPYPGGLPTRYTWLPADLFALLEPVAPRYARFTVYAP